MNITNLITAIVLIAFILVLTSCTAVGNTLERSVGVGTYLLLTAIMVVGSMVMKISRR